MDCSINAYCYGNITFDNFTCECKPGYEDVMPTNPGRQCEKTRVPRDGKERFQVDRTVFEGGCGENFVAVYLPWRTLLFTLKLCFYLLNNF